MSRLPVIVTLAASLLLADDALAGGPLKTKAMLVRPDDGPDADAKGEVRLRTDLKKDEHEFEVRIDKVDGASPHSLFVEDALGSGIFVLIDALEQDDDDELKLKLRTKKGDTLPLDAGDNAALEGFAIQIRSGEDIVVHGLVPDLDASKKPLKAKQTYGPAEAGDAKLNAKLKLRSKAAKGDERFDLQVLHLGFPEGRSYTLFVEDAVDSDVLVDAGGLDQLGTSANARYRRRTKDGQALPGGVMGVAALGDRRFEVRDDEGGVYVEGEIPAFDG